MLCFYYLVFINYILNIILFAFCIIPIECLFQLIYYTFIKQNYSKKKHSWSVLDNYSTVSGTSHLNLIIRTIAHPKTSADH